MPVDRDAMVESVPNRRWLAIASGLLLILLFAREPRVFLEPAFWAEEIDLFFANALYLGGESLWNNAGARAGYSNAAAALAAWFASLSIDFAPGIALALSALFQFAALVLALFAPRRELNGTLERVLLAFVILWFPYAGGTGEAWFNSINSQVHLGIAALLLALGEPPRSAAGRLAANALLAVAVVSGPYAVVLLPIFLYRAKLDPGDGRRVQVWVVAAGLLFQFGSAMLAMSSGKVADSKSVAATGTLTFYAAALFQFWFAVIGEYLGRYSLYALALPAPAVDAKVSLAQLVAVAAAPLAVLALLARSTSRTARIALFAAVTWSLLTAFFSVNSLPGFRYAVPATAALGVALLAWSRSAEGWVRGVPITILVLGLVSGAAEYFLLGIRIGTVAPWQEQIAAWRGPGFQGVWIPERVVFTPSRAGSPGAPALDDVRGAQRRAGRGRRQRGGRSRRGWAAGLFRDRRARLRGSGPAAVADSP